ncbi:hypothetical protein [Lactobacillus delbrueckii]|uniref:hypothetical protein n=1 Tax=Lactobacillus delbrueckii TaxID=1584 RepID=UPI000E59BD93|nr:hypothetical protein [Lactobacillus delbrueckii]RHX65487.1 hypothetical protein DSY26_07875 [Lactobacillus delbrueckii]
MRERAANSQIARRLYFQSSSYKRDRQAEKGKRGDKRADKKQKQNYFSRQKSQKTNEEFIEELKRKIKQNKRSRSGKAKYYNSAGCIYDKANEKADLTFQK